MRRNLSRFTRIDIEHGEPPAPMMSVYEYMHKRHIEKEAKIKTYQMQYRDRM